jgi:hypothetical protein
MKMKKGLMLMSALVGFALASCGPTPLVTKEGVGYGLVHGHYVGIVSLSTENDVVKSISIDEYFLPYNWGKVTATAGTTDTVTVATSRGTNVYAEFVKIGDKTFSATVLGEGTAQSIKYSNLEIADLDLWTVTEANAKWYVERIDAEDYGFVSASGQPLAFTMADASAKVSMIKSESGYWSTGALGWAGNIAAIEELLLESTMDFDPADFAKNAEGYWAAGTITTGATLTDFKDYLSVALRAYANRVTVE